MPGARGIAPLVALLAAVALGCGGGDDDTPPPPPADSGPEDAGAADVGPVDAGPPEVGDEEELAPLGATSEGIALGMADGAPRIYVSLQGGGGVVTVSPAGEVTPFADVPGALGLAVRSDGTLVACGRAEEGAEAAAVIWEIDLDGTARVLITQDQDGQPFSLTNYIAVAPDGSLVFTDSEAEVIHAADADGGSVRSLATDISYPNGLAFTPSGDTLWVASWDGDALFRASFDAGTGDYGAFEEAVTGVAAVDGLVATDEGAFFLITSGTGVLRLGAGETSATSLLESRAILLPANGVMGQGAFGREWLYIAALGSTKLHRVFTGEAGPALPIR